MKKIGLIIILLGAFGFAQVHEIPISFGMNQFCASPPFVGGEHTVVIPNVLLCHDFTGSMRFYASGTSSNHSTVGAYVPGKEYYGYADPNSMYDTIRVGNRYYYKKDPGGYVSGNEINWWHMTRMDISRKVLTGGKGVSYNNKDTLYFDREYDAIGHSWRNSKGVITTDSTEVSIGVIRQVADEDKNFVWDEQAPNFALMTFSTSSNFYQKVKCPFGSTLIDMINVIEDQDGNNTPSGGTPVGDAIFEAIHYLRYCAPHWSSRNNYSWNIDDVGNPAKDPWYEMVAGETLSVSCRPTFCIVFGDGGSNGDASYIDFGDCNHLPHTPSPAGAGHDAFWKYDKDEDFPQYSYVDPYDDCSHSNNDPPWTIGHDRPGDDYAYYAHVTDLRPDADSIYGIPADQTITFYSIYLWAQGESSDADSMLFRKIAKHGGFHDLNGDKLPGPAVNEYDNKEPYGRPDNFFYADEGYELENAFTQIFIDIAVLARVTSASAATISSSGVHGEGLAYTAQFYPLLVWETDSIEWVGAAHALWLDPFGHLREDTDQNFKLHLKDDYIVDMFFDSITITTKARIFEDTSGTGIESLFIYRGVASVESIKAIWKAADKLMQKNWNQRWVWTNVDTNYSVEERFTTSTGSIDKHLQLGKGSTAARCDSLIKYVLGLDFPENPMIRSRSIGGNVWKLGDIIYSSPAVVGRPQEGFHLIYGDATYQAFMQKYDNRPNVIYVGANDGMIHAFNAGIYTQLDDPYEVAELTSHIPFWLYDVGHELWAYIPYNLLPHLKWLPDTSYCHVYYNDLQPYATDAQIFPADSDHPDGWGTLVVCGQRFGGGQMRGLLIQLPAPPPYRQSYTAFDATKSYYVWPEVLWEWNDPYLGYALCNPALIKVQDSWFLLIGSGPYNLYGECRNNGARLYVLDPYTGAKLHEFVIPDVNTAITNVFGADWGLDYTVDLIYFGTYDNTGGGKIYRIETKDGTDPARWQLSQVIDLGRSVTSEGSVATDDFGNLWVYFGTGKYYSSADIATSDTMLFVGIMDDTAKGDAKNPAFTLNDLLDVTDIDIYPDSVEVYGTWDSLVSAVLSKDGWVRYFDSLPGERILSPPTILGGGCIFTSFIPTDTTGAAVPTADLCITTGGTQAGNLWALFYTTGTAYLEPMLGVQPPGGKRLTHQAIIGDIPSAPVMHIGMEKDKVYIQTSGGLIDYETPLPYDPRGGVVLWRGR